MTQHRYRITLEYLADADGHPQQGEPLAFEINSHYEIIGLVERVRSREILDVENTPAFVVGQKLFAGVLLENRNNPLFAEFLPHFADFMKKLKGTVKK